MGDVAIIDLWAALSKSKSYKKKKSVNSTEQSPMVENTGYKQYDMGKNNKYKIEISQTAKLAQYYSK